MNNKDIEKHFDTAKEICLILNGRTIESQTRILRYFQSLVNERGDMQEEQEILNKVTKLLGIKGE